MTPSERREETVDEMTHQHAFTIPVEWKEIPNGLGGLKLITVIRLRCSCGDEMRRKNEIQ